MSSLIDRLEMRWGHRAIPGLIRYVVLLNALVYVLQLLAPGYTQSLDLVPAAVWQGEIWRLFTWVFLPGTYSPFWILFALLFLWFLGDLMEGSWTSFRVNLFYLSGWFFTTLAALLIPGVGLAAGANVFLNLTVLFAAATLQPNYQILLFFVIPLKLKWLAVFSTLGPALLFLSLPLGGKIALLLSMANYLIFFAPGLIADVKNRQSTQKRRARFEEALAEVEALHHCCVCGRTDESHPDLEFRVTADGTEYCREHLPSKNPAAS